LVKIRNPIRKYWRISLPLGVDVCRSRTTDSQRTIPADSIPNRTRLLACSRVPQISHDWCCPARSTPPGSTEPSSFLWDSSTGLGLLRRKSRRVVWSPNLFTRRLTQRTTDAWHRGCAVLFGRKNNVCFPKAEAAINSCKRAEKHGTQPRVGWSSRRARHRRSSAYCPTWLGLVIWNPTQSESAFLV